MEKVSEILTRIIFGGKIEDKLAGKLADQVASHLAGSSLTSEAELEWDEGRSLGIVLPEIPHREGSLSTRVSTGGSPFPKKSLLLTDTEVGLQARGRLLHSFANHELLAIETMAYTLLKFPDAPLAFKKGVFGILQDEQRHLKLYLERMKEFGVEFGSQPLSFYFWNTLVSMQNPMDFVVRMSLTFEQANLDFAMEYAGFFEKEVGDSRTSELLRKVHDDEVLHVAHGLKWFREWRGVESANKSEWENYCASLPFPVTARRAKGSLFFQAESRRRAGFDEDYIERLRIVGGSRGSVPDYFFFNPQCEIETQFSQLPGVLNDKIVDLAPLLIWLAQEDDVVELPAELDLYWQKEVFEWKGCLPEMIDGNGGAEKYVAFSEFRPWGWGPSAWRRFEGLKKRVKFLPPFSSELHKNFLFSKAWFKQQLGKPLEIILGYDERALDSWIETAETIDYLLKRDSSTSGRGHFVLPANEVALLKKADVKTIQKIRKKLGDEVWVIEPFYDKIADFSVQYELLRDGTLKVFEPRFFLVDRQFQYRGAFLGMDLDLGTSSDLCAGNVIFTKIFEKSKEMVRALQQGKSKITEAHEPVIDLLRKQNYVGPFGVDGLISSGDGELLKIIPVVEVNARFTMGRVAHEIEKAILRKLAQQKRKFEGGFWYFFGGSDLASFDCKNFSELHQKLLRKHGAENVIATTPQGARKTWTVVILAPP